MPPGMFQSLRSRAEHRRVNRELARLFRAAGARRAIVKLYEGPLPTLYLPTHDIWLAAHELPNRYRNALGTGDPRETRAPSPSVQLNLALAPGGARPRARFMRSRDGEIWLAHSGTLGGRQAGISRESFVAFVGGARTVAIDDRSEQVLMLGCYAQPVQLVAAIAQLAHAAHAFRSALAAGLSAPARAAPRASP